MTRGMWLAAGAAVVGLVFAGCGDDRNAPFAVSDGEGGGEDLFAAMADAQHAAGSYHLEFEVEAGATRLIAEGMAQFGKDPSDIDVSMTLQDPAMGDITALVVDDVMYISGLDFGLPEGTSWVRIDPTADDPVARQLAATVDVESSVNLQAYFNEFADEITVVEGDNDTMAGVEVTEYVVTIDAAAGSEFPGFSAGDLSADELPFDELTYSMWVDGDALLRQITSDLGGFGSMEGRFFDYGEPVEIEAPPADEVADLAAIMQDMDNTQDDERTDAAE